jgi:hypothetical protein
LGKLVFSTSNCFDETIDLNWLRKGIYIYKLNFDDQCFSQKFIVGGTKN